MARAAHARRSGAGLFNVVSVVILIVGVVVIGIAAALLARTLTAAQSIDKKAAAIAANASRIDASTDPVLELNRTNELASSILESARPLKDLLVTVDNTARDIAGIAKSIDATAGTINETARTINDTAGQISETAGGIDNSVGTINDSTGRIGSAR